MPIFKVLADPILPVFAILALGFAMGRFGYMSADGARAINKLAMVVLLPTLLFGLIANAPVENFRLAPLTWYFASEIILFTAGYLVATRLLRRERGESVLMAFAGIFSNSVLFVLPISLLIYGPDKVLAITAVVTLDSTIPFAAAIVVMQVITSGRATVGAALLSVLRTPLLIAMVAGAIVNLSDIVMPGPIETFVHFNGSAAGPVALFALGVVLSRTRFSYDPAVLIFSVVKLILFPVVVGVGLHLLIEPGPQRELFQLTSAGPAGAMAFSLALLYGVRTDAIAQIIIFTSALSLLTLAILAP